MISDSVAFEEGVKLAFLKRIRKHYARKRLAKHIGVEKLTPKDIERASGKAFNLSSRFSESRPWNTIRRLAREAGYDTMGRELARV